MQTTPFVPDLRPSTCRRHRLRHPALFLFALLSLCFPALSQAAVSLNAEEQKLAQLLIGASGQKRDRSKMYADERLCQVARARAMDMARRKYFDHVNPDGHGPNYLVRQTGYTLPSHYNTSKSGNNIESIGCGYSNASAAWSGWMGSSGHKTHLLATQSFYTDQTAYGVGYHYDPSSPYGRYYVVLTAPPASAPVTLTITSPLSGSRVATNAVTVTGQVSGADTVGQMLYRLENATGTGAWQSLPVPSGSTVSYWSTNVSGLALGTNTVRVRTLSATGSLLKEATRSVRMAILRPLTVEVSGDGSVNGAFAGTTQREVGMVYRIRALPRPSAIFSHWDGFADASARDLTKAAQTFAMTEGLVLRANFIPNPFFSRNGVYEGLVLGGTLEHGTNGFLRLNVARTGGFSGQLILGATRFMVRGTLNGAGSATLSFPRPGLSNLTLSLQLDLAGSTNSLAATLNDATTTWTAQANRRAPRESGAPPARRYTFRIDPDLSAPENPRGFGFGTATVNAANVAVVTGRLGDGRPLASSASMTEAGAVAIFAPQFGRAGAFYAALQISPEELLSGTARWFKPERPLDLRHSAAFNSAHTITGGRYLPPAADASALARSSVAPGVLTLSAGNLEAPLEQPVTLGETPVVSWATAVIPGFRLNVNPVTGNIGGAFVHSNGTLRAFRGVMIQPLGGAWGQFAGPTESGAMQLEPGGE